MSDPLNPPSQQSADVTTMIHQIEDALSADPRFDVRKLAVRVIPHDEGIGLIGWVTRLPEKIWIEQIAADIAGAQNVASCLVVGPPDQRPDTEIAHAVRDLLDQDRSFDSTSIEVHVSQGVVQLDGIIDTTLHRRFAGALC